MLLNPGRRQGAVPGMVVVIAIATFFLAAASVSARGVLQDSPVVRMQADASQKLVKVDARARILQSATPIDPATYPAPQSQANVCPAGGRSPNVGTSLTDACPHKWPDVKLWESASTWPSGVVPANGAAVTLPAATKVLITGCSLTGITALASITVPQGSELIFDDGSINLTLTGIYVYGVMRVGSETCRVPSAITITFVPAAGGANSMMGLRVFYGGLLELHGALFSPTWTRLAATAAPGATTITLQAAVNWKAGQLVALPTSIYRDELSNQNEVKTLQAVSTDGRTLTFTSPLAFYHYGGSEYQTEVVLLSRTILLQGNPASQITKLGGHVRIEGQGRIEGALAYRMGQLNVIGVYPFHWHMVGDTNGTANYIKDSSVYNAFFRCYTVHGTNGMLVRGNTAFHATGHCFYIEDGVEERNTFERNFAGFVHTIGTPAAGWGQDGQSFSQSATLINPADSTAGGFYAANPNNHFRDNAASGGWCGFAFPTLPKPVGMSTTSTIVPRERPLGTFSGNTAHSTGYYFLNAGGFYFGGKLWTDGSGNLQYTSGRFESDPKDSAGNPISHVLNNNKAWLATLGISHWGPRVQVNGWESIDNVRGAAVFGRAHLRNAIINLNSGNLWDQYPDPTKYWSDTRAAFQFYDVSVMTILSNITIMNIANDPTLGTQRPGAILSLIHSDEFKPAHISTTRNIKLINVSAAAVIHHDTTDTGSCRYFNFLDWDGSVTSRGRPTQVTSFPSWWRSGNECTFKTEWNSWTCDWYPWRTVGRLDMRIPGYTALVSQGKTTFPASPDYYAGWAAQFGSGTGAAARNITITRNEGLSGLTGNTGWYVHWKEGVTPFLQVWMYQVPVGSSIIFATRYPPGTTFSIAKKFSWFSSWDTVLKKANSLAEVLNDPAGESYWFSGKHLYIKMVDPGEGGVGDNLVVDGAEVPSARWYSLSYDITATNLAGCTTVNGGQFCRMADDMATDIPPAITTTYNMWTNPYCVDIPLPDGSTCAAQKAAGACSSAALASPSDPYAKAAGGYCSVTCARCVEGTRTCVDVPVPSGLSGGKNCTQLASEGACWEWWIDGFCGATCGQCNGKGKPCVEKKTGDGNTCAQFLSWGSCPQSWMIDNHVCDITCGRCSALVPPSPPPRPPPPSPPPRPPPPSPRPPPPRPPPPPPPTPRPPPPSPRPPPPRPPPPPPSPPPPSPSPPPRPPPPPPRPAPPPPSPPPRPPPPSPPPRPPPPPTNTTTGRK